MTALQALLRAIAGAAIFSIATPLAHAAESQQVDEYAAKMLKGVRSVWFNFTEVPSPRCPFAPGLEHAMQELVSEFRNLGIDIQSTRQIEQGAAPDLAILVLIEASANDEDLLKKQCAFLVKLEAFHLVEGRPHYGASPLVMRVLAYRTIWYGTAGTEAVRIRLHQTAAQAIARFALNYAAANK